MKKFITIIFAFALVTLALSACGAPGPGQHHAGKWDSAVGSLEFQALEFIPDETDPLRGRVNLSLMSNLIGGSYEITLPERRGEPGLLKITYSLAMLSTTRNFNFTIDQDTLVLQSENSSVNLTYTRGKP